MKPWKHLPWLAIDTETTGLTPGEDRIVELAAVRYHQGRVLERRGMLLDPERPIPAEASEVHGIRDEDVAGAPTLAQVAERFLEVIAAHEVLVGYNWPFDAGMLAAELGSEVWAEAIASKVVVDPLVVVRFDGVGRYWKGQGRHKLTTVAERLRLRLPTGDAHRASYDAILACRVLEHLIDELPDDGEAAMRLLETERERQQRDFEAWKARQPMRPREARHA